MASQRRHWCLHSTRLILVANKWWKQQRKRAGWCIVLIARAHCYPKVVNKYTLKWHRHNNCYDHSADLPRNSFRWRLNENEINFPSTLHGTDVGLYYVHVKTLKSERLRTAATSTFRRAIKTISRCLGQRVDLQDLMKMAITVSFILLIAIELSHYRWQAEGVSAAWKVSLRTYQTSLCGCRKSHRSGYNKLQSKHLIEFKVLGRQFRNFCMIFECWWVNIDR